MAKRNVNCLQGLRCPRCGQQDELLVWAKVCVSLTDDGTDPFADSLKMHGDVEYDNSSTTQCPDCDYQDTMLSFMIRNQPKRKVAKHGA